jgi:hypothetical protein
MRDRKRTQTAARKIGGDRRPAFRPLVMAGSSTGASKAAHTCGECAACCIPYRVPEIEKPAGVPCRYIVPSGDPDAPAYVGGGCACYQSRPEPCRHFHCLWIKDLIPDEMRPDKVGYIVATNWAGGYVQVNELVPEATDRCLHFQPWVAEVRRRGIEVRIIPPIPPQTELAADPGLELSSVTDAPSPSPS